MKIEVKNVKVNQRLSEETTCFSATVYIDGKRAGEVGNHGHGGPNHYYFANQEIYQRFEAFCKAMPPHICSDGYELAMDADLYLDDLINEQAQQKHLKRLCKKETLFRLKDGKYQEDEWQTVKAPYSPKVQEYLDKKYGDRVSEILNKTVLA